jgi:hypothetical protein
MRLPKENRVEGEGESSFSRFHRDRWLLADWFRRERVVERLSA